MEFKDDHIGPGIPERMKELERPSETQQEMAIKIGDILLSNASKQIDSLTRQLQIAKEGLEGIMNHEHCEDKNPQCTEMYVVDKADQTRTDYYQMLIYAGRRAGHRCCSSLAAAALKKMGEVKP